MTSWRAVAPTLGQNESSLASAGRCWAPASPGTLWCADGTVTIYELVFGEQVNRQIFFVLALVREHG
jgi:hypothetical protein